MDLANKQKYYKNEVIKLVNKFKDNLNKNDFQLITEYIDEYEWGIGFELLCDRLEENLIQISNEDYGKIVELGKGMKIREFIWGDLKKLVK